MALNKEFFQIIPQQAWISLTMLSSFIQMEKPSEFCNICIWDFFLSSAQFVQSLPRGFCSVLPSLSPVVLFSPDSWLSSVPVCATPLDNRISCPPLGVLLSRCALVHDPNLDHLAYVSPQAPRNPQTGGNPVHRLSDVWLEINLISGSKHKLRKSTSWPFQVCVALEEFLPR